MTTLATHFRHYRILFSALRQHHPHAVAQVISISLFVALISLVNIATPYLLKHALDALSGSSSLRACSLVGLYALCWTAAQIAFFWKNTLAAGLSAAFERGLSLALLDKLFRRGLSQQAQRGLEGETYARFTRAATSLGSITGSVAWSILPAMLELLGAAVMLTISHSPWLALIVVSTMLVFLAASLYSAPAAERCVRRINQQSDRLGGYVIERLGFVTTMHLMNAFEQEGCQARQRYDQWRDEIVRSNRAIGLMYAGKILIIGVGLLLTLLLAARNVINGSLGLGDFVMINAYILQFAMPMTLLAASVFSLQRNLVAQKEAVDILSATAPSPSGPRSTMPAAAGSLIVRQLQPVITRNKVAPVSFELPPGQMLGLHGVSGVGKSALADALLGLTESEGSIHLGDLNAREADPASWRRLVVGVPQAAQAVEGSLRDNICYGLSQPVDEARLQHACYLSCLDDFIAAKPDGLDFNVAPNGDNLSGGEKMRLALARALVRQPVILILDEPTAALDAGTELELLRRIKRQGITTLVISHSANVLTICDQVLEIAAAPDADAARNAAS